MEHKDAIGPKQPAVPRLGVGAMIWGDPRGLARLHPAQTAYGGCSRIRRGEARAEVSLEAGVNLFDTAAMYSLGAAERRLGELARGRDVLIATKYPAGFCFRVGGFSEGTARPRLARLGRDRIDLYQHHFPNPAAFHPRADGSRGGCGRGGQGQGRGREQLLGGTDAGGARRAGQARDPAGIESSRVFAAAPPAGSGRNVWTPAASWGSRSSPIPRWAWGLLTGKYSAQNRPGGFFRRHSASIQPQGDGCSCNP